MALVKDWQDLEAQLPARWVEARIGLTLEEDRRGGACARAARAAPADANRTGRRCRSGSRARRRPRGRAPSRCGGRSSGSTPSGFTGGSRSSRPTRGPPPLEAGGSHLPESWDAAVAALPADWSDVLGEIELDSSDYVEPAALNLAPMNPRRVGNTLSLQFRSARLFGYGASPGMVRRCLERCDAVGITGRVEVLRVLSDTRPVGTQGPVWQIEGRMV